MDLIAEQFALRDRFRKKMALLKTPEQRMSEMFQRQREMASRMSPEGYAHFMRRNFKARAVHVRGENAS